MLPRATARLPLHRLGLPAWPSRRRAEPADYGVDCGHRVGSKHDPNRGTAVSLQRFKIAGRLGFCQCAE